MPGCCGGNGDALIKVKEALGDSESVAALTLAPDLQDGMARMEYIGPETGPTTFFGKNRQYRGANNAHDRYADVDPVDVDRLVGSGRWRLVVRARPTPEPVQVDVITAPVPEPVLVPAGFDDDEDDAAAVDAANRAAQAHTAKRRRG